MKTGRRDSTMDLARAPRLARAFRLALIVPLLVVAFATAGTAASTGVLTQLPGGVGCITASRDECFPNDSFSSPSAVVVSQDGKHAYVIDWNSDAVIAFARNPTTGTLAQTSCVSETGAGGCDDGVGLEGPSGVAISRDGKHVYVASLRSGAIAAFTRDSTTGALSQIPGPAGCVSADGTGGACAPGPALEGVQDVVVSRDGKHVYAVNGFGGAAHVEGALLAFSRDRTTGALTQLSGPAGCVSMTGLGGLCTVGKALGVPFSLALSRDGKHVYVASWFNHAVAIFTRDRQTGALSQPPGPSGCVGHMSAGCGGNTTLLMSALSVAITPDGKHLYAIAGGKVVGLGRDRTTGQLTLLPPPALCVSEGGSGSCADGTALQGATAVTVSPNGSNVYIASSLSDAVAVFGRDKQTGTLTQLAGTDGCVSEDGTGGACADGRALDGANHVAVSPNGKNVYVTSSASRGIAIFRRD